MPTVAVSETPRFAALAFGPWQHYLGWSVFRHSDVVAVLDDHEIYSSQVSDVHPAVPNG